MFRLLVLVNTLHCHEIAAVQSRKPSQKYEKLINMFLLRLLKNAKTSPNISSLTSTLPNPLTINYKLPIA